MTLRKIAIAFAWFSVCSGFFACNSSSEPESVVLASNTAVSSFSLSNNDSVLTNLDSVFFSIDLVRGTIFNADSLPYGTKVNKLVPVIATMETTALLELKVTRANGTDTTYNYSENPSDSIDFTNPVVLRVLSANGDNERNYTIRVNVHTVKSDSLVWNNLSAYSLPSSLAAPKAQRTVRKGDNFFCLTTDGTSYSLARNVAGLSGLNGVSAGSEVWKSAPATFPFSPRIESFAASDNALFLLADDSSLWTSTDDGITWDNTGFRWANIYGGHRGMLVGNLVDGSGRWMIQTYPEGTLTALPDGMPVSGTSVPVLYSFAMSNIPQSMIVGGRCSDGSLSVATWGFDGTSWVKISRQGLPVGIENAAVAPYSTFIVSEGWSVSDFPSMLLFGGTTSDGELSSTVYMSNDYGIHWMKADDLLQMPETTAAFTSAQAYVMASVFKADLTPAVVKPLESWECPYIYLFGGTDADGNLTHGVRRGVINRFTFKPIE